MDVESVVMTQFIFALLYVAIFFESLARGGKYTKKKSNKRTKEKHFGRERFKLPPINIDREKC